MSSKVYIGSWINWTDGRITGATLTLSTQHGAFLVAFLALFVRLTGDHVWGIFCYTAFQLRSSIHNEDAFYHQQQATLRNAASNGIVLWDLTKIGWYWRSNARQPFRRSVSLATCALVHICAFIAASILSSKVTSTQPYVLLEGQACGVWPDPFANNSFAVTEEKALEQVNYQADFHANAITSSAYASSCYNTSAYHPLPDRCLPYGRQQIEWTTNTDAQCPFSQAMCADDTVVQFDTGFINSHTHLGINSRPQDRIDYRRVMTCAPMVTEGFVRGWNNGSDNKMLSNQYFRPANPGEQFLDFFYGPNTGCPDCPTYSYSNYSFVTPLGDGAEWPVYALDVETSVLHDPDEVLQHSSFTTTAQLNRTDADVSLIFLAQNLTFSGPIDDPWFRAQDRLSSGQYSAAGSSASYFVSSSPVSVLGCIEQHQVCNPAVSKSPRCTNLSGSEVTTRTSADLLGFNTRQMAIFERTFLSASLIILEPTVSLLGAHEMLAMKKVGFGNSAPLPSNQWILELNNWFGTMLTHLQLQSLEYITGPSDSQFSQYITPVSSDVGKWMCGNQIVRRDDHTSFNILGITIILGVGVLCIIIDLSLSTIGARFQRKSARGRLRNAEWTADGTLHLQRAAFENYGLGAWRMSAHPLVPLTNYGEKFPLPSWPAAVAEKTAPHRPSEDSSTTKPTAFSWSGALPDEKKSREVVQPVQEQVSRYQEAANCEAGWWNRSSSNHVTWL